CCSMPSASRLTADSVPNSIPVSQTVSAYASRIPRTVSGRASVVKSRSVPSLPSTASRTLPPTRNNSWPASANAVASGARTSARSLSDDCAPASSRTRRASTSAAPGGVPGPSCSPENTAASCRSEAERGSGCGVRAVTAETLPSRSDGFRPQRLDRLHLRGPRQQIASVLQERLRGGRVPVLLVHHQDVPVRVRGAVDVGLVPVVGLDRLRHVPTPDLDQLVPLARLDRVPEEQCVRCVGAHTADSRCTDHGPRVAGRHGGPCDTGTTRSDPPHPAGSTAFCDVSPERPCPGLRWDPTNCGGMSRIAVEFHRTRSSVPSLLSTTLSVT